MDMQEWVEAQLHMLRQLPDKKLKVPALKWRRRLYAFVTVNSTCMH